MIIILYDMKEELVVVLNLAEEEFRERNISSDIFPTFLLWEWSKDSFYGKRINEIQDALDLDTRGTIFQIICLTDSLNMLEITKLTKYSYGLVRRYISQLEKLQLINVKKGKSSFGKMEATISKHENIKILFLSELLKDEKKTKELFKGLQENTARTENKFKEEFFKNLNKIRKTSKN